MTGLTPPSKVMEVYPTLKPLVDLANGRGWRTAARKTNECDLASVDTPALPTRAFRMSLRIPASVETVAHVIEDAACIRRYDPTMDEYRVLEERREGAMLYTSFKQQSWLVAPRDFCVVVARVLIDAVAARRQRILPENVRVPEELRSVVYVQNSVSCQGPRCPVGGSGQKLVHGTIHVFGYIIREVSRSPPIAHVDNYCCVEAGGSIPNWVVGAAVGQNCEKLQKIKALATALQETDPRPLTFPFLVTEKVSGEVRREEQEVKQSVREEPAQLMPADSVSLPPPRIARTQVNAPLVSCNAFAAADTAAESVTASPPLPHPSPMSSSTLHGPNSAAEFHTPNSSFAHEEAQGDAGTCGAAVAPTVTHRRWGNSADSLSPPRTQPPSSSTTRAVALSPGASSASRAQKQGDTGRGHRFVNLLSSDARENAIGALHVSDDADATLIAKRIGALARALGWIVVKESESCTLETLAVLPQALLATFPSSQQQALTRSGARAIRVSTVMDASLETVKGALESATAAPAIEATLTRLVPWRRRAAEEPTDEPVGRREKAAAALLQQWQLRHYVCDKSKDSPAWDLAVRCTSVEVPQCVGAALGLHSAGVRAGSIVWGALDASEDVVRDPHSKHRRATAAVLGWTATAIPITATSLRVSHYSLLAMLPGWRRGGDRAERPLTPKEARKLETHVPKLMLRSVQNLRALVEGKPGNVLRRRQEGETDPRLLQFVDGAPLMALLADVHRVYAQVKEGHHASCTLRDEMAGRVFVSRHRDSSQPLNLHVRMGFPCTLEAFAEFALCARRGMRTVDPNLSHYSCLYHARGAPSSRDGAAAPEVHVYQVQFNEHSSLRPSMNYSMMESAGFLDRDGTFILARVNCNLPLQRDEEDEGFDALAPASPPQRPVAVSRGNVYYDGYVVCRSRDENGDEWGVTVTRHMSVDLPAAVAEGIADCFFSGDGAAAQAKDDVEARCPAVGELVASLRLLRSRISPFC